MNKRFFLPAAAALALALLFSLPAIAQRLPPMGIPLTTTIIVNKPAPGQVYGDKQLITFSVNGKVYKYVLKDAYVDSRKYVWPDIWDYVRFHQPNMVVMGQNADQITKIEPGETAKVRGMFAAMNRTFEVMSVEPAGEGGPSHY